MGLLKFFARVGAVGGTARTIAKQYLRYRQLHPDKVKMPEFAIYRLIIMDRYAIIPNKANEQRLIDRAQNMEGLAGLVREILTLEAGFSDNSFDTQQLFMDVICEELKKKGVSTSDIFGH